jgi:2-oxoglutarate dehydrogenase E2 component (dihydrolipoamide succinyltransferase)
MPRITMPQLGETVTEGTVTRWLKLVGDHVAIDEPLLEVSTEKVDTEVPSAFAGVLRTISVDEGETVAIGTVLCVIGDDDVSVETSGHAGTESDTRSTIRREMTGHQAWLDTRAKPAVPPAARARPPAVRSTTSGAALEPPRLPDLTVRSREPFSTARRRTATHLRASLSTAAHTLTTTEVDYSAVDAARRGTDMSYLPFIARAVCAALREFPRMNASMGDDELVLWEPINLGIAVDLDHRGLVVPVIRDADDLRLASLGTEVRALAAAARRLELEADAFTGGTFTITNAGGYGTVITGPVINTPQVAILSVDGIGPRPVAVPDGDGWGVAVRVVGNLSLSFDHRAIDGAYATAFLADVRDLLESTDWSAELGA